MACTMLLGTVWAEKASPDQAAWFQESVLPVLSEQCFGCHGSEKQKSGLRLDSRAALVQGGSEGPAVVPGNPENSILISALRWDGDYEMPPGEQLPEADIALLTEWVKQGAPWPEAKKSPAPPPPPPPALSKVAAVVPNHVPEEFSGPPVDFNREIRPILSENCFTCHGPDAATLKAGLRFDDGVGGYAELPSGNTAIVPGAPAKSALMHRIFAPDSADRMPPPGSDKTLTEEEINRLGRWIAQGAQWDKHWAFVPPNQPELPDVSNSDWPRNGIDRFILARLDKEGLTPSPEASRETLIRRLSFDLTGLPPTPEEIDAFLADTAPDAYENVVDRLLASPRYGEHMARYWLDLARYADTNGYHIDNERFMWRWRDWVIDAYNQNMPFDQFTTEQLAGDLLPEPTLSQRIATGFNRNHMINFEGGAIPEEYQTQYVVDRVNTTSTVWLGLTMNCAQCHDHKYDPLSQREYFEMYSFFNNVPEEGLDGRDGNAKPFIKAPLPEQVTQLAALNRVAEEKRTQRDRPMPELDAAQTTWASEWARQDRWEILTPGTVQDKEDGEKGGMTEIIARSSLENITALRLDLIPRPQQQAEQESPVFELREIELEAASITKPSATSKIAFTVINVPIPAPDHELKKLIDGNHGPGVPVSGLQDGKTRTVLLAPKTPFGYPGGSELRLTLRHNATNTFQEVGAFRVSVSTSPDYAPVRLSPWHVSGPYRAEDGKSAFETAYGPEEKVALDAVHEDGREKWIKTLPALDDGKIHPLPGDIGATYLYRTIESAGVRALTLSVGSNDAIKIWLNDKVVHSNDVQRGIEKDQDTVELRLVPGTNTLLVKIVNYGGQQAFYFRKSHEQLGNVPLELALLLEKKPETLEQGDADSLRDFYRGLKSPEWQALNEAYQAAVDVARAFDSTLPTTMVMEEMDPPRITHILNRGQYDQPGEAVTSKTPAILPPFSDDVPTNRLGLAQWLCDPEHPLTARIAVNRDWQRFFGTGIVKTTQDFGAQGEWPSHPDLLDWLATEFVRMNWDVKSFQRLLVTSAAYRQSSRITPELLAADPENRLLARGPRQRLDAEMVRDNALAVSGLLVERIGGPSVRPHQPAGLWDEVAYGAGYSAQVFKQDEGDANYRRSMYTFWKRQAPPPNMMIFDAPNRETCATQRESTNTPLQALVLMNDQQYVEAARALGARILTQPDLDQPARIAYAFRLVTSRYPTTEEQGILLELYHNQYEAYSATPEAASSLLSHGAFVPETEHELTALAAWTMVASTLLNMDETLTKG